MIAVSLKRQIPCGIVTTPATYEHRLAVVDRDGAVDDMTLAAAGIVEAPAAPPEG